jgi:prepilin-type N-terminal cleavage/methylation domain-containing protein
VIRTTSRGFSLLEVIMAMGILAIGLAATVPLVTYGIEKNALARRGSGATMIAEEVMQRLQIEVGTDFDGDPAEGGFPSALLWSMPILPHNIGNSIGPNGACGATETCCQPAQATDGVVYDVAFPMRAQGEDYLVCYAIRTQTNADSRGNFVQGMDGPTPMRSIQVKVLWQRMNGGWSFRTASGFAFGQAALN